MLRNFPIVFSVLKSLPSRNRRQRQTAFCLAPCSYVCWGLWGDGSCLCGMRSGCSSGYGIQCWVGVRRRSRHRDSSRAEWIKITENETGTLVAAGSRCTLIYCIYTASFVSVSYEIFIHKKMYWFAARVQLWIFTWFPFWNCIEDLGGGLFVIIFTCYTEQKPRALGCWALRRLCYHHRKVFHTIKATWQSLHNWFAKKRVC